MQFSHILSIFGCHGNAVCFIASLLHYSWAFRDQLEWEITGQISRRYVAYLQADVLSDLHIPLKKKHQKKKGHWISKNTRKEMKKCSKAWHKYRSFRPSSNYEACKSVRNKVTSLIRADDNAYRKRLLKDFKGNPRRFYRQRRNLQTVKDNVTALKTGSEELTTSDQEATDTLGEYFQEVFTQEDNTTIDRPTIAPGFRPTALAIDFSWDTVMKHLQYRS